MLLGLDEERESCTACPNGDMVPYHAFSVLSLVALLGVGESEVARLPCE